MMNFGYLKVLLLILCGIAMLGSAFKILKEYERAVIFRLGKLLSTKGPGLIFLIPFIDRIRKVDLRIVSIDVPRQDIMTMDNVPVTVDAVVYFQIVDPAVAVISIQDIYQSTFLLAQATLRNVLGQAELDDLLSRQAKINQQLQEIISIHTKQWGICISIVEIKEVTLPEQMKRAMAKQAETERERRARLIDAQGEYQASQTLAEAGKILSTNPQGFQLRYLQTLRDISSNKGSTVLFPFPMDLFTPFLETLKDLKEGVGEYLKNKEGNYPPSSQSKKGDLRGYSSEDAVKKENLSGMKKDALNALGPQMDIASSGEIINLYKQDMLKGRLQPRYVQWVITEKCQFKCSHCETRAPGTDIQELTIAEAERVVDGLAELGCEFLSLTGGEPMMRKDLFDILCHAKKHDMKLGLTTNGQATEENLDALANAKLDSVVITLDGYGQMQNKIRNSEDAYERGIRTIEFFHDIGIPRICVSSTLLDENLKEFPRLTEDVFRAGANMLQVQPRILNNGRSMRNPPQTVKDAFRFIIEARRRGFLVEAGEQFGYLGPLGSMLRSAPFFCGCGWNTFCIISDGKVQGCPVLLSATDINEGDCRVDKLKTIWQNKFAMFRKDVPEDLPDGCCRCPHISLCRGGCWLFRIQGLNPCFLREAEEIYREITDAALYTKIT